MTNHVVKSKGCGTWMTLGDLFKETRIKQKLAAKEIYERVGISKSYYTKVENNQYQTPAYEMALRIAEVLSIDKDTIDSYYDIGAKNERNLKLVSNSSFIKSIIEQNEYVLSKEEIEALGELVNVSVNLKKEGFKPEEMIKVMEILRQFISA